MNDSDESASSSFENEESSPVSDIVEPLAESSSNGKFLALNRPVLSQPFNMISFLLLY